MNWRTTLSLLSLTANLLACGEAADSDASSDGGSSSGSTGGSDGGNGGSSGASQAGTGGQNTAGGSDGSGGTSGGTSGSGGGGGSIATSLPPGAIAASSHGTCALDAAGQIHCWGLSPEVWPIPTGSFVELVGNLDTICAIREDRSYVCFYQPYGIPDVLDYAPEVKVREVKPTKGAICVIDQNGVTVCEDIPELDYYTVPNDEGFEHISAGLRFACGMRVEDGSITCWGDAGDPSADCMGILAAGHLNAPTGAFAAIASGGLSSCAIDDAGALTCWGAGEPGDDPAELCDGYQQNYGQASPPPGAFKSVSLDFNHACGIMTDGSVACWGAGKTDDACDAVSFNCGQSVPPPGAFEQVVVGYNHSCAITADRKVQCWGYDEGGRITPPAEFQ